MPNDFFKFPRTPHLLWPLDRAPKDDRVLSAAEAREFLSAEVVVEEKIDGANVGFSLDDHGRVLVQNRGSWIEKGVQPQFQPIWSWIAKRQAALSEALQIDRILYGEWCFAVHSVRYDRLPDWFLGFDIYDRTAQRFWSTRRRDSIFKLADISAVPRLYSGRVSIADLKYMLDSEQSRVSSGPIEGLYLRREGPEWLEARTKLVRPEFLTAIGEHWSSRQLERNALVARPVSA
jgi:hypothetical protein